MLVFFVYFGSVTHSLVSRYHWPSFLNRFHVHPCFPHLLLLTLSNHPKSLILPFPIFFLDISLVWPHSDTLSKTQKIYFTRQRWNHIIPLFEFVNYRMYNLHKCFSLLSTISYLHVLLSTFHEEMQTSDQSWCWGPQSNPLALSWVLALCFLFTPMDLFLLEISPSWPVPMV